MPTEHTGIRVGPMIAAPHAASHPGATGWQGPARQSAVSDWPVVPPEAVAVESTLVSETVETLSRLLDRTLRETPRPFPLKFEAPVTPAEPRRFAATLANAVTGSGVFFEAHLAEWVRGERSLDLVRTEAESRAATVAPAAEALQQQLSLLATDQLAFQFAAWPGQSASLTVGPEPEDPGRGASPERDFIARLETEFRGLGPIRATLNLTSCGVDVALQADSPQTAAKMRAALATLTASFAAAGLRPGRIEVDDA